MNNLKIFCVLILALLSFSCSSKDSDSAQTSENSGNVATETKQYVNESGKVVTEMKLEYNPSDYVHDFNRPAITVAGLKFTPATQWREHQPSGMKAASFAFGPLEKETDSAVVGVFFFGTGEGGSVDANLKRWIEQMAMPDGRDPAKAAIQYTLEVDGMKVHMLSLYGIFLSPVGGPMSRQVEEKPDYRLVGAIVEGPLGNVFFKLTGPEFTARIMIEAFMPMIKEIKKA